MKNVLLFLLSFTITVACVEFFLKFTRITPPTLKYYNSTYGSLNRPNIDYFKSVEGMYIGKSNYDGRFRENYAKRKSDKKALRIILIGDSFVEGIDVFSNNHFARYIEDILRKRLNRKVEVLNFGRGNCTIQASSYYFTKYISQNYDADIVLYFTEARDIYDFSKGLEYPSTCFILDSTHNLATGYLWKNSSEYKIHERLSSNALLKYYDYSAYFRLLYRAVARVKISGLPLLTFGKFVGAPLEQNYSSVTVDDSLSLMTMKIYDTIYKYNAGQVIFVVRNKPAYTPVIIDYMKMKDYKYINLSDTFDDFNIRGTKINAYYFKASNSYGGHWNNDGHKAVGYFLSRRLFDSLGTYNMPDYQK